MVTFSNRIELWGMVEGEVGVVTVKMDRVCLRVGLEKDGEDIRL